MKGLGNYNTVLVGYGESKIIPISKIMFDCNTRNKMLILSITSLLIKQILAKLLTLFASPKLSSLCQNQNPYKNRGFD